jgi:hypothetical protein
MSLPLVGRARESAVIAGLLDSLPSRRGSGCARRAGHREARGAPAREAEPRKSRALGDWSVALPAAEEAARLARETSQRLWEAAAHDFRDGKIVRWEGFGSKERALEALGLRE